MKRKSAAVIAAVMSGALLVTGLGGCRGRMSAERETAVKRKSA